MVANDLNYCAESSIVHFKDLFTQLLQMEQEAQAKFNKFQKNIPHFIKLLVFKQIVQYMRKLFDKYNNLGLKEYDEYLHFLEFNLYSHLQNLGEIKDF